MRDDPGFDREAVARHLRRAYGVETERIDFLPIGHDVAAFVYETRSRDGAGLFLKLRRGAPHEPALAVPRALAEAGVSRVMAPLPTRSGAFWSWIDGLPGISAVMYPFVAGENAMVAGLSADQWTAFGRTLRAVHDAGLATQFAAELRVEDFALPSAASVRELSASLPAGSGGVAGEFAAFWAERQGRIDGMLERAESLGRSLQAKRFERVLCHSDIHAANILVDETGEIWLVDWDGPLVAPRERDLLFVIGSRIAREERPEEERAFFAGYGSVAIDPEALRYYRYERIIEDLGEFGRSVFRDPLLSDAARRGEAELAMNVFTPDGEIARAEHVDLTNL